MSLLLTAFDQAYNRQSWHGTNLRGSIRGLTPEAAAWRPGPGRHNIWELVVHCAYWKYAVWRRLTGEKRGSFRLEGSNFFDRPVELTDTAWRADVRLLEEMHQRLRRVVVATTPRELTAKRQGKYTAADLISGITAHDLYHAGQIQLIKRLQQ
jgi:uncharacterized damage-inducible protein DinB